MKDTFTSEQTDKDQNKDHAFELNWEDITAYFHNLKDRHSRPVYILIVTFWVALIAWWVFSVVMQVARSDGDLLEGPVCFVMMVFGRIGYGTLGAVFLVWLGKQCSSRKRFLVWGIGAACLAFFLFLGLRNPIRDIPYLSHPEKVVLENWKAEQDQEYVNSSFYTISGRNADGELMIFNINSRSCHRLWDSDSDAAVVVEYLPYTEMVMSLEMQ